MSTMQKRITKFFVVTVLVCLIILIYKSLTGISGSGIANSTSDIPHIGKYLQDLHLKGDIDYVYSIRYTRPAKAFLFTAGSSSEEIVKFFGARAQPPHKNILRQWTHIIKSLNADPCVFPVGIQEQDLSGYRVLHVEEKTLVIRATYCNEDQRLTCFVLETRESKR